MLIAHVTMVWVQAVWFVDFGPLPHAEVRTRPAMEIKTV